MSFAILTQSMQIGTKRTSSLMLPRLLRRCKSTFFSDKIVINDHPLFKCCQVAGNVWRIEEKYFDSWNLANIYFVKGLQSDLLVDTGIGIYDLGPFLLHANLREDREKPMKIVLTHMHFDHSGGAHAFDNKSFVEGIYIHHNELPIIEKGSKFHTAAWVTNEEILPKPYSWTSPKQYHVAPVKKSVLKGLQEGDELDLGDMKVKVIHLPGHSPGSIGLLFNGTLVTGDTVYSTDHELIDWYPGSSTRQMATSVTRILDMSKEIELALPGHNDVMSKDQLIEACQRHVKSCETNEWRIFRKFFSRTRASTFLALNHFGLPVAKSREWIKY